MSLFGISGSHTTEACPLNNSNSAKLVLDAENINLDEISKKYKINKIIGQFHSALEHSFLWILDAEDAHLIQQFCIESGIASFNSVKIIPLITFDDVIKVTKKVHSQ